MMIQAAAVDVGPDDGVIVDKLDNHSAHVAQSSTIDEKKESPSATDEEPAEYGIQYAQQQQHHIHQQHAQQQQHLYNPYAQHQYAPHMISGIVPPQQVYIQQQHQHQMPLESHFQSMGFGETNSAGGTPHDETKEGNNTGSNDADNGGGNNENESNNDGSDDSNNAGRERQVADGGGDENETEEEPIKLFVGQVRKELSVLLSTWFDLFPGFIEVTFVPWY